ncbi:unnamed protein product [Closterium sp. Yama58-4]|nr:unnamed protein product [Closterium sp. Yama58-4]
MTSSADAVTSSADAVTSSVEGTVVAAAGAASAADQSVVERSRDRLAGVGPKEENPVAEGAAGALPSLAACFSSLLSAHLATPSAPNRLVLRSVCSHRPLLLLVLLSAHTAVGWGVCGHAEEGREEEDSKKSLYAGKDEEEEEEGKEKEWNEEEKKGGGLRRVVKLMCRAVGADSNATREADEWGAKGHAEDVYVMPVTASELQDCLSENSLQLPPTCREFNGFTVSFLQV